jgi:hypothetical protein
MNAQSRALWDFLAMAQERGLSDEFFKLFGSKLFNPSKDLVDNLGEVEDLVLALDLEKINSMLDQWMEPVLKSLTNEETIDGMKFFLTKFGPGIKNLIGDDEDLVESAKNIIKLMMLAKNMMLLFGPVAVSAATPYIMDALKGKGETCGVRAGQLLNGLVKASNDLDSADPDFLSDFARGFKKEIDSPQINKATDRIVGVILDQKPQVARFAFRTFTARLKRKFGNGGRN